MIMILLKFYYYITLLQLNYINGQLNECDNLQENQIISNIIYDTNEINPIDNNKPLEEDIVNIKEMEWNNQKSITRSWPLDVMNNDECHQMTINSNVNNPCQELKQNQKKNEKDIKCNEGAYKEMNKIRSNQNNIMINKEKSNRIYGNQFDEFSQTECNQIKNVKKYDIEHLNWKMRNEEYDINDEENTMIIYENIWEKRENISENEITNKINENEIKTTQTPLITTQYVQPSSTLQPVPIVTSNKSSDAEYSINGILTNTESSIYTTKYVQPSSTLQPVPVVTAVPPVYNQSTTQSTSTTTQTPLITTQYVQPSSTLQPVPIVTSNK
ncbi:unnamed protein product, partial [Schistosoma margrebowiei]